MDERKKRVMASVPSRPPIGWLPARRADERVRACASEINRALAAAAAMQWQERGK